MPELPEVETIRRQLSRKIIGKTIKSVKVRYSKVVRKTSASAFRRFLVGQKIKNLGRHGKLLFIRLANSKTIVIHLKLAGRLLIEKKDTAPRKLTEVVFGFKNFQMFYDDLRRFGWMKIISTSDEAGFLEKEKLGPDFFSRGMNLKKFKEILGKRGKSKIKPTLMDQSLIAGIGNIYAQEACFTAGLHPERKISTLSKGEFSKLYNALARVMKRAVGLHGASTDAYIDAFGKKGSFVPLLKVYGREGEPCLRCKIKLKKQILAGRGTVWCSGCQK